ncbi:hypothetical protein H0H93_006118 [Arthromyces matolae]|nr:hypothetical protein H0H93_006118 [Arthromyces matolae]
MPISTLIDFCATIQQFMLVFRKLSEPQATNGDTCLSCLRPPPVNMSSIDPTSTVIRRGPQRCAKCPGRPLKKECACSAKQRRERRLGQGLQAITDSTVQPNTSVRSSQPSLNEGLEPRTLQVSQSAPSIPFALDPTLQLPPQLPPNDEGLEPRTSQVSQSAPSIPFALDPALQLPHQLPPNNELTPHTPQYSGLSVSLNALTPPRLGYTFPNVHTNHGPITTSNTFNFNTPSSHGPAISSAQIPHSTSISQPNVASPLSANDTSSADAFSSPSARTPSPSRLSLLSNDASSSDPFSSPTPSSPTPAGTSEANQRQRRVRASKSNSLYGTVAGAMRGKKPYGNVNVPFSMQSVTNNYHNRNRADETTT